ncbi:MAG: DUF177 domain-containing protein [Acidobacteriota bacterium]|nr:DUF177 domain-containing protein [Acidobacteriota bacterium]
MIVDLVTIKDAEISFDFVLKPDEIDLEGDEAKLKNEIKVKGSLRKGIAQTDVTGKINAEVEVECSRCLQNAEQSLEFPFSAVFVTPENYTDEKEAELKADDLDVSIIEDDKIELKELVREQILLAIPAQVFCREDCKGLCQKCGANRNLIDCNCEEKEIDPRWQSLRELNLN